MDAAPHVRLLAKLAATEEAVQALLAECQQPDVVVMLEVRCCSSATGREGAATHFARARSSRATLRGR